MARRKALKLSTPIEVRRALSRVANMVLNNELSSQQANTIIYGCNIILGSVRVDEQQRKLDELEKIVQELTNGTNTED